MYNYLFHRLRHCERQRSNPGVKNLFLHVPLFFISLMVNKYSSHYSTFSWIATPTRYARKLAMTRTAIILLPDLFLSKENRYNYV
jgi:hypothetical protein